MPGYCRPIVAGATYFLTLVAGGRRHLFADGKSIDVVRQSLATIQRQRPFEIDAAVVLPDHLHFLWTIPDGDVSTRGGRFKVLVTRAFGVAGRAPVLNHRNESDVWQARFWDHVIRDDADSHRHLDYIHYNPVKHGHATCPHLWQASSFKTWVGKGVYEFEWCCQCDGMIAAPPRFADLDAGE